MSRKIILDVDTGIDDSLAVLTAAVSIRVDLVGCTTTWGNVDVETATRNTAALLELAEIDGVPVAAGAAGPLNGAAPGYARHVHGDDGQGGHALDLDGVPVSGETAAELIIRLSHEHAGELHLVAVGPLTNLALALEADPTLPERVPEVTIMGGAFGVPGNITPVAEANIIGDPEAAQRVIDAAWSCTFVGLDVTMEHLLTEEHRAQLNAGGEIGRHCGAILDHYFDFYADVTGTRCAANHDALALGVACGKAALGLAPTVRMQIDTTDGPGRGQTIADRRPMYEGWPTPRGARHRIALEVDEGYTDWMVQLLAAA
ncbi:nucleoside hydrolase [Microbacterium halophytorum]|uniref:nucleoside hydrolase n=1 Tax=Microbacterium halophytorum TaxID=2067568 RepID=UPI000CFB9E41|nr:nucleoside hydrolase [Microbacterium halophytorum]